MRIVNFSIKIERYACVVILGEHVFIVFRYVDMLQISKRDTQFTLVAHQSHLV